MAAKHGHLKLSNIWCVCSLTYLILLHRTIYYSFLLKPISAKLLICIVFIYKYLPGILRWHKSIRMTVEILGYNVLNFLPLQMFVLAKICKNWIFEHMTKTACLYILITFNLTKIIACFVLRPVHRSSIRGQLAKIFVFLTLFRNLVRNLLLKDYFWSVISIMAYYLNCPVYLKIW